MYEDYYSRQAGGQIPVFVSSRYQPGHGLGSVLGGLVRRFVIPLFTTHDKTLALNALRTGMDVAEDVLGSGRGVKESVKKRVPEGIKKRRKVSFVSLDRMSAREDDRDEEGLEASIRTTFLRDSFRTRHVLRMYEVGVASVFRSTDSDQHGTRQLGQILSHDDGERRFAHRIRHQRHGRRLHRLCKHHATRRPK